mmetsp:Transcript_27675/g.52439  ORF Transcript_27675/g.52439 Transcript_27675/m.52439 type:complete len:280 (+) Transcript_27675:48-887(+)
MAPMHLGFCLYLCKAPDRRILLPEVLMRGVLRLALPSVVPEATLLLLAFLLRCNLLLTPNHISTNYYLHVNFTSTLTRLFQHQLLHALQHNLDVLLVDAGLVHRAPSLPPVLTRAFNSRPIVAADLVLALEAVQLAAVGRVPDVLRERVGVDDVNRVAGWVVRGNRGRVEECGPAGVAFVQRGGSFPFCLLFFIIIIIDIIIIIVIVSLFIFRHILLLLLLQTTHVFIHPQKIPNTFNILHQLETISNPSGTRRSSPSPSPSGESLHHRLDLLNDRRHH